VTIRLKGISMRVKLPALASVVLIALLFSHASDAGKKKDPCDARDCTGIVQSFDPSSHKLILRTRSKDDPAKEVEREIFLSPKTLVEATHGQNGSLSDLKVGSVVTYHRESSLDWGNKSQSARHEDPLDVIMMQSACTPDTCARSRCNRNCKSVGCKCLQN